MVSTWLSADADTFLCGDSYGTANLRTSIETSCALFLI